MYDAPHLYMILLIYYMMILIYIQGSSFINDVPHLYMTLLPH